MSLQIVSHLSPDSHKSKTPRNVVHICICHKNTILQTNIIEKHFLKTYNNRTIIHIYFLSYERKLQST